MLLVLTKFDINLAHQSQRNEIEVSFPEILIVSKVIYELLMGEPIKTAHYMVRRVQTI